MASVTSFTAARMKVIEDTTVVGGSISGNDLVLTTREGSNITAGNVRGPKGDKGDAGSVMSVNGDSGPDVVIPSGSDTAAGLVELATAAEALAGTDTTRAVTPAGLSNKTASVTQRGIVRLATAAEAIAGTDVSIAVTPSALAQALPGYRLLNRLILTSSTTFTKASYPGLKALKVIAIGGGGGGGGAESTATTSVSIGGSGGGGGYAESFITNIDSLASSVSVTVGAGGTAGTIASPTSGNGGASSFGALVVAGGGTGGIGGISNPINGVNRNLSVPGGTATAGDILIPGGASGPQYGNVGDSTASINTCSPGLPAFYGTAGPVRAGMSLAAVASNGYGSGGIGAANAQNQTGKGGVAGQPGLVIIEIYVGY